MHGRTRLFPALLATVALAATGCGGAALRTSEPRQQYGVDLRSIAVSAQQQQVLAGDDDAFARALWTKLATGDGNVVVSPASIATALQMAYVGARGETAAEMARTLHLGTNATPTQIAAAASKLLAKLAPLAHDKHSLLTLADEVWLQHDFPVVPSFRDAMATGFGSAFHLADFANHGEDARKAINAAIAAQTRDRIRDLFPAGSDLSNTRLVLTNAIYLKAAWATPFERSMTAPAAFTRGDRSVVHPDTMKATDFFDYAATHDYQAVRLPYAGNRLAMTLLLPAPGGPLAWPTASPHFESQTVDLTLPKFRFSWNADLAAMLRGLGMPTALSDSADFSGMSTTPLHIGVVQHKAFIAVDENGTEAAAATAVAMDVTGARVPTSIATLHLDRPFLFRIDDTVTGLPLFLGKVADPTLGA
jgi:serpin B